MNLLSKLCVSAAACCLSAAALAAPVFLEASVKAYAAGRVWVGDTYQVDQRSASFTAAAGSQRVSASVYASRPSWGGEVQVSQDIEAVMNGESAGTVAIQTSMVARDPVIGNMSLGEDSGFRYRFQAGADGILRVGYQVQADPLLQNTSDEVAFNVWLRRPGTNNFWVGNLDADSTGTLSLGLDAGQIYELVIQRGSTFDTFSSDFTRAFSGFFEWSIEDLPPVQAVPEPAGLWLVLTALGAGAALRGSRRR